jgi:hypothetical protein
MTGIVQALIGGLGTAVAAVTDAYFNLVTLLLPGNGTNGAQNNTFLDSSSNAFTITRNGNTTQGTFTPFSQTGWGNYFDGSSNLSASDSSFDCAGDFTVEAWFYAISNPEFGGIINTRPSSNTTGLGINLDTTQKIRFYINGTDFPSGYVSYNLNQWNHVALVRSGSGSNNVTAYLNGTSVGTTTNTSTTSTTNLAIGKFYTDLSSYYLRGYVSNARLVNGTALYTSNFTPSTTPLTAVTNTKLLTCQSNRFVDNSSVAATITVSGTPSVQAFSPFAPTAAYDTAVVGGSGYFDGSGDYLTVADNAAFDFNSGNFTIEFWVYSNGDNEYMPVEKTINGAYGSWYMQVTSGSLKWNCSSTGSSNDMFNSVNVGTVPTYAWTHIAIVRNGTTFTGYINGVGTALGTSSATIYNSSYAITVGSHNGTSSYDLNGYIAGLRLIKGTAVYTSNFTPSTTPPTAITNTSLLLNFTNAGIYDATAKNDLETVGNAQVSTTQSKFGGASMAFDGTGDYLQLLVGNQNTNLGTGDFTIEMWVYPNSWVANGTLVYKSSNLQIGRYGSNNNLGVVVPAGWLITDATLPSTGTWTHVAVTRSGTSVKVWINGTQSGSTGTSSASLAFEQIGGQGASYEYNGYIDDFRVTKFCRYTTTFTPPTAAFPVQ